MFDFLQTYLQYPVQTAIHELWGVITALFCLVAIETKSIPRAIACIGCAFLIPSLFISYEYVEFLRIEDLGDKDIENMIFLFVITFLVGFIIIRLHTKYWRKK